MLATALGSTTPSEGRERWYTKTDPSSPTVMREVSVGDSRIPTTAEVWAWCSLWGWR